jgi:hypothetical protein
VREEFGDLLAEGLMSLLHARTTMKRALDEDYWEQAIAARHALLNGIKQRLSDTGGPDSAVTAVAAARDKLRTFDGEVLAMYVRRWREDVRERTKRVQLLPRTCSVEAAVDRLGLPTVADWCPPPRGTARVKRSSNRVGSWLSGLRSPVLTNPSLWYSRRAGALPSTTQSQARPTPVAASRASMAVTRVVATPDRRSAAVTQR